jgi:hypothetical protein
VNQFEAQLILGVVAIVVWGLVFYRWAAGNTHPIAGAAVTVGFASALIVLVFGSLYLLGAVTDEVWALTGTLLRAVVALAGITVLVAETIPERESAAERLAATVEETHVTATHTAEQVDEIHDATVKNGGPK